MSNSNHRITDCETVHHLTSRIAHRVYSLPAPETLPQDVPPRPIR